MPGFLDPKAYIFDLDGTLIDSLGVWDKVDEILASEIARVDYSDLDLPRFREISLAQNSESLRGLLRRARKASRLRPFRG